MPGSTSSALTLPSVVRMPMLPDSTVPQLLKPSTANSTTTTAATVRISPWMLIVVSLLPALCFAHPVGQLHRRLHVHLLEHPRPVHLDRAHADVQLVGDQLVGPAVDHPLHDLALALGQLGQVLLQRD